MQVGVSPSEENKETHFVYSGKVFIATAQKEKTIHLITKDLSWLWRTAYNCAVQGCSEWEACEERISDLFDVARDVSR